MSVKPAGAGAATPYSMDDILKYTQPEKKGRFKAVMGGLLRGAANIAFPGLGGTIGSAISTQLLGSAMPGLGAQTTQYLAMQQQINQEQLAFTTISTMLKVRHDAAMDAVRNMKQ
jgi:hypothetical protein